MVTYRQLLAWGNAHPDAILDIGDLSAGMQHERTAIGRCETLKRLLDAILPVLDSLMGVPKCDTMSFPDLLDDQKRLLFQVKQRAEWRKGLATAVVRDLAWFQNAHQTIQTTLLLLTP